jgi:hypothetical protein
MAEAAQDARLIDALLHSKGMLRSDRICQTTAEAEFDLEVRECAARSSTARGVTSHAEQQQQAAAGSAPHCGRSP